MRSFRGYTPGGDRSRPSLHHRIGSYPLPYYAVVGLLGVVLAVGAQTPSTAPAPETPRDPTPMGTLTSAPASSSPMDEPLRLVAQARQTFQKVRDYSCLLVKQERVRGQMLPEEVMDMRMRNAPFSVYFRWVAPRAMVGQEVCYVAGRNNNMMRVRASGLRGAIGFISISPTDARVMQHSRHTITEAGLGNVIDRLARAWDAERRANQTQVRTAEYEYNRRRCVRVEAVHPRPGPAVSTYRTVVYFDKQNTLPIRVEMYDWPRQGGTPGGELMECYSYVNLRLNVNLPDATFNH